MWKNQISRLLLIDDVPDYLKDNVNILSGYRKEINFKSAINTIYMWHNETLNIWSHLLSFLLFGTFLLIFNFYNNNNNNNPKWPLTIYLLGAMYLFIVSTTFHTLQCMSRKHYEFWRKMDFIAIIILMFSMFVPFCYYGFVTNSNMMIFAIYITTSGLISVASISVCILPEFQKNKFEVFRPVVFAMNGVFALAPIIHLSVLKWKIPIIRNSIICVLFQLLLYIIGSVFYVIKFPEKIKVKVKVKETEK